MSTLNLNRQDSFEIAATILREKSALLRFTASGYSMAPFILDGDVLEIQPYQAELARPMEILLYVCDAKKLIAHRLLKVKKEPQGVALLLRGDSRTGEAELVRPEWVLGRVVAVKRCGRWMRLDNPIMQILARLWVITPDAFRRVLWSVGGGWLSLCLEKYFINREYFSE